MKEKKYKYDVALSFAGENRTVARTLADRLRAAGYKVFFDEYEKAALWGEDLAKKLEDIYKRAARYCVIFVSREYTKKLWTNFERQAAILRAFEERTPYILPLRLDDTELPGLPNTFAYLDLRSVPISEVFELLSQKLGMPNSKHMEWKSTQTIHIDPEPIRKVLAACYRRAIFTPMGAQMNKRVMFDSLFECRTMLQKMIVYVEPAYLQRLVASIIGELDFIERRRALVLDDSQSIDSFNIAENEKYLVNGAKLRIIAALLHLRNEAGVSFELPSYLISNTLWNEEEAKAEPDEDEPGVMVLDTPLKHRYTDIDKERRHETGKCTNLEVSWEKDIRKLPTKMMGLDFSDSIYTFELNAAISTQGGGRLVLEYEFAGTGEFGAVAHFLLYTGRETVLDILANWLYEKLIIGKAETICIDEREIKIDKEQILTGLQEAISN